mgnify:FL=1
MLVLAGLKPATDVVLEQHDSSPEEPERLLSQAGLQYARVDRKLLAEDPQIAAYYAVANDPAFARELAEILSFAEKTPAQHQRFGQLMGYPQTAINAFAANQTLDDETTLPQDIVSSPFYFKLSSAHAPEEMARIREWDDALRRYAPDLDRGKE